LGGRRFQRRGGGGEPVAWGWKMKGNHNIIYKTARLKKNSKKSV